MGALPDDQERRKRRRTERKEADSETQKELQETTRCHVDQLPPEILLKIFSYLKLEEQLSAHQVSRRWRAAATSCLALRRDLYLMGEPPVTAVTDAVLEWLLPRMPRLRCLVVGRTSHPQPLSLDIVSRHCRHLITIGLMRFHVDEPSLRRLCASCPRLRAVILPASQCRERSSLGRVLSDLLPQLHYWAAYPFCHRHRQCSLCVQQPRRWKRYRHRTRRQCACPWSDDRQAARGH